MKKPPYVVLVVDDDQSLLVAMVRLLSSARVRVFTARTSADALKFVHATPPDVVIADMLMPGNGLTLCRHIAQAHPQIALIMMSGLDEEDVKDQTRTLGAVAFLSKPFPSMTELAQIVEAAAEESRARRLAEEGRASE